MRWLPWIIFCLAGCTLSPYALKSTPPAEQQLLPHNTEIFTDTVWRGSIIISDQVKVFKGATLTIEPGTDIAFKRIDRDRDGLGDGVLIVEGRLLAIGTPHAPIRFHSAETDPAPGDWLELRVDFSRETTLRYCEIRDSAHSLHAHFTKALVEDSHIHHNNDGSRLGQGDFTFRRNLIENNEGKGINFRNSTISITDNIIRHNGSGIFLFETDRPPIIDRNNLYGNGDNLRLGDFFHRDIETGRNWWGSSDPEAVASSIYDAAKDPTIGRVSVQIAPAWFSESGPRDTITLQQRDEILTGGFIDSPPLPVGTDLLLSSWDGTIRRIAPNGKELWKQTMNDVIDAPLVVAEGQICGQTWGREVFCLGSQDGKLQWKFTYPPSPADDHRQGGLLKQENILLVPAWNGNLYALDLQSGQKRWSFQGNHPLRATPLITEGVIYLAGGDGTLWALSSAGELLWKHQSSAPLLTPPVKAGRGVVVVDRRGQLTAIDRNGERLWTKDLDETCYYAAPVTADDGLFIATAAGSLWKIAPGTGETIWRQSGFAPIYATPLPLSGHRIALGDNDGTLSILSSLSGEILSQYAVDGAIQGGPTLYDEDIAFGSRDRKLHILTIKQDPPRQ